MMHRQQGAALVLCIMLLASLSLLGVSAASDSLLQQRMGANRATSDGALRSAQGRLQSLESALRALPGEQRPPGCPQSCITGLPQGAVLEELHVQAASAEGLPETSWFRLTAISVGAVTDLVTVQSVFARPWGNAAWSGDTRFCQSIEPAAPCGRLGWQQLQP
jgi:Tfp pilus assembly protein PilX